MKYTYEIINDGNDRFCLIRKRKTFFGKIKIEYHYNNGFAGPWWCKETAAYQWACWRESLETLKAFKKRYELGEL